MNGRVYSIGGKILTGKGKGKGKGEGKGNGEGKGDFTEDQKQTNPSTAKLRAPTLSSLPPQVSDFSTQIKDKCVECTAERR